MGCFLGCFGGDKNHKRRKPRPKLTSPQIQRNRVQDVHHETVGTAEETTVETPTNTMVAEVRSKPVEEEKPSPSPRKKVAFSSKVTTYEHVSVGESIESLVERKEDVGIENSGDFSSEISTVGSFPPNHRYHNARESDDEADVYGDSDLDNLDEDDYNDYEPVLASSTEFKSDNYAINEEVNRSGSIENVTQSEGVDASLSNWLEKPMLKKTSTNGLDDSTLKNFEDRPILGALTVEDVRQISVNSTPKKSPSRSPDEIPIIGTVGTFWSHSASSSTRDDSASLCRGMTNATNKYSEDVGVDWDSTPFEMRLDRALNLGASEG